MHSLNIFFLITKEAPFRLHDEDYMMQLISLGTNNALETLRVLVLPKRALHFFLWQVLQDNAKLALEVNFSSMRYFRCSNFHEMAVWQFLIPI